MTMKIQNRLPISMLIMGTLLIFSCRPSKQISHNITGSQKQINERECINQVIALDDSLGKVRNYACETISLSETIQHYVDGMHQLNYRHCSKAFSTAFKKHRDTWVAMLAVTDHYPDLRGEMHVLFDQLETSDHADEFKSLLQTIWDTWAEVEAAMKE
ncbi:MAG: hypothetical protein DHS20C18_32210 [Saprospiraceae bacterium]|nr:MAG: hypothetical protein DHS20C18_32210 [Saprospiraceae bacterium]